MAMDRRVIAVAPLDPHWVRREYMDSRRIAGVAARVLGVALIALVVVLTLQVRHLWGIAGQFDDFRSYPHAGQWVPPAALETLAGDTVVLGDADSTSTEVVFTLTA